MAESVFQVKSYCRTGVASRAPKCGNYVALAQVRSRRRRRWCGLVFGVFFLIPASAYAPAAIAASSRSPGTPHRALELQPICPRSHQTCRGVNFTPHSCTMTSRTRGAVHNSVAYPKAPGPRLSTCSMHLIWLPSKRGLRPARPAPFNPGKPFAFKSDRPAAHRLAMCPTCHATSAWLMPWEAAAPLAVAAAPKLQNPVRLPVDFPCGESNIETKNCHYILSFSITTDEQYLLST